MARLHVLLGLSLMLGPLAVAQDGITFSGIPNGEPPVLVTVDPIPIFMREDPKDLKQMKASKWIVVSVERDGKTVPAQYGQRVGDIIGFEMDTTGQPIFG